VRKSKTNGQSGKVSKKPPKIGGVAIGESEDSDTPLGARLSKEKVQIEKTAAKEAKAIRKEERKSSTSQSKKTAITKESGEDEELPMRKKRQSNGTSSTKQQTNGIKKDDSDDDVPLSRKANGKTPVKKIKAEAQSIASAKKGAKGKATKTENKQEDEAEEGEEEEEYRWWEDPSKGDGTIKWTTLEHNGVVFPPPYQQLPKHVCMHYDGVPIMMDPAAEEVAVFFGSMLNSEVNVGNPTFTKNFFEDFSKILKETGGATGMDGKKINVKEFAKCDFQPIFEYTEGVRLAKKAMSSAEKKIAKQEKDTAEEPYMYCTWDGRKQKVGNFRVEPPSLFRGRGEHPKTGRVKKRVAPEQITINIGKEATVPAPPPGHRWKEVKHDQEGTWLAMWQENINGAYKYVMLAANSDVKGQSDYRKFEKARELKVEITRSLPLLS
jgi:DNA topoisomerase-1